MNHLVLNETVMTQWYSLVNEAKIGIDIHEDLESYLVGLLMRYTERLDFVNSVIALEYLQCPVQICQRHEQLRDIGDKCLLFSGLFPGRAKKKRVRISYFVDMGQNAYASLSTLKTKKMGMLFYKLSQGFVQMMDVLHAMRQLANEKPQLAPLEAFELWQDTGSQAALQAIKKYSADVSILPYQLEN